VLGQKPGFISGLGMNVTFFAPYASWSPHFETELELMQLHLDSGDDVTMITCDAALNYCEANQEREFSNCAHCVGRAREGLKRLSRPVTVVKLSDLVLQAKAAMKALWRLPRTYESFDQLYPLKVENFDLGAAVLSTLNSVLDDPEPDPSTCPDLTWATLSAAFAAYTALDGYLEQNACDLFYVLNGRLANFRAALRVCQKHKVRCLVHERGSDHESYSLAENTMPHDPAHIARDLAATLQTAQSFKQKEAVAHEFYTERREGKIANWISLTDDQIRDSLPEGWLRAPARIAMFTSTEAEFTCLREYYPPRIYPSQYEGLATILEDLNQRGFSGMFAVRMHPNSARTKSDFTERLRALPYPFLRVIPPEEKLDSYALLQTAQKVLTWGSTIGIEAAYWKVPSIVAGWGYYMHLGSTYNPDTHDEVMDLLLHQLKPKPIAGAIDFGFYSKNFGRRFKYVTPSGAFWALFKGSAIWPGHPYQGFISKEPSPFEKWQRSLWTIWNQKRLDSIYRGHPFTPEPISLMVAEEQKIAGQ
jgi:hypothetical protein